MIDTVILEIVISLSAILNPSRFKPKITGWITEEKDFGDFKNNPTKEDKKIWGYLPRLTIFRRGGVLVLKLEFSVFKLLTGGENINEPEGEFANKTVTLLREAVERMGVFLSEEQVRKARVMTFHPSKNIILSGGYSTLFALSEFSKVDISKKFDIDTKEHRNGGEVLQFYSNLHAFCLYDPKRDSRKPPKRAFDKDQSDLQKSLFGSLSNEVEILRMEARPKKPKFKDIFEKIGYDNYEPTFEDILNRDLCQKILKYYWDYFFGDNMFLFDTRNNPQRVLNTILDRYKGKKLNVNKAFSLAGFVLCAKDKEGMRGVRNVIEFHKPKNNWSKTRKWLDDFRGDLDKSYLHGFIEDIERQLDEFKPLKLPT